jgi:hypothetical protein
MMDAGMPMPALVFRMPMPTYDLKRNKAKWDSRKETRKDLRNETKFYL